MIDSVPPHSPEIEAGYLGGLMFGNLALTERYVANIQEDDFYLDKHREIFRAAREMAQEGRVVNLVTLADEFHDHPSISVTYLAELAGNIPDEDSMSDYRSRLLQESQRRFLRAQCQWMLENVSDRDLEPLRALEEAAHAFGERYVDESSCLAQPISSQVDEFGALLDRVAAGEQGISGRPSGYRRLDQLIAGFQSGRLYTIAARTGAGKTTFACNLAHQMAGSGTAAGFFSLEMGAQEIFQKLVAVESGVDLFHLRKGVVDAASLSRAREGSGRVARLPLYINDGNKLGLSLIERDCARLKQANCLDAVFVDYLQLMWTPPSRKQRYEAVGELSRGLKAMARKLDVPVIACAQLSRKADEGDKEPQLHHLRESGSIEQDSDVVLMLWRDGMKTQAKVAKNRNGPTGRLQFDFDQQKERFTEDDGKATW